MKKILLVDFSLYRDSLAKTLRENGYDVTICGSAFDAMSKLNAFDYDLIVSEVELPGDNAFDLYNYLVNTYPYIPIIMTTEQNIDNFFERIFQEGIGNLLCKPINKEELLHLADKLITKKNIFGLNNYMDGLIETKKIKITNSKQINNAIKTLISEIKQWGYKVESDMTLSLVLNEMVINAVYHSHGFTKEKEARIPVQLPEGQFVDLFFARNATGLEILEGLKELLHLNPKLTPLQRKFQTLDKTSPKYYAGSRCSEYFLKTHSHLFEAHENN